MDGQIGLALELQHLPQALCDAGGAVQTGACIGCARHKLPLRQGRFKPQHIRRHMGVPPLHTEPLGFPFVPYFFHSPPNVLTADEVELPVCCVFP